MNRRARNPFTFSDGTVIPRNAFVSVAADHTHRSEDNYSNPNEFNGFRFSDMPEEEGEGSKYQMVALGTNHMPFGNGRHAW
jgi:cytochrome P450